MWRPDDQVIRVEGVEFSLARDLDVTVSGGRSMVSLIG